MKRYELPVTFKDSVARIQLLYRCFYHKGPGVLNSLALIVHTFTARALYATTMEWNYSHFPPCFKSKKSSTQTSLCQQQSFCRTGTFVFISLNIIVLQVFRI